MITRWILGEPNALFLLVEFCVCAAFVIVTGTRLSRYGNWIGEVTGLSGAWVGMVFLAFVTSLPELATSVGAILTVEARNAAADLALGDLFGSCAFNLAIIVLLDAISRRSSPLSQGRHGQVLTAAGGAMMMGVAAFGLIAMGIPGLMSPKLGWVFSAVIAATYFAMVRMTFRYERSHDERDAVEAPPYRGSAANLYARFAVAAGVIVVCGLWLAKIGEGLSTAEFRVGGRVLKLGETFVGTVFLAVATSMPEVVVTAAAFRIGAINMGLGNIFGSNVFNIGIIPLCDVAAGGRLFANGSLRSLIPLCIALVLTSVAIVSLIYRPKRRVLNLGWDSVIMFVLYVLGMIVLFRTGTVMR